jgi:hypothetical protein
MKDLLAVDAPVKSEQLADDPDLYTSTPAQLPATACRTQLA